MKFSIEPRGGQKLFLMLRRQKRRLLQESNSLGNMVSPKLKRRHDSLKISTMMWAQTQDGDLQAFLFRKRSGDMDKKETSGEQKRPPFYMDKVSGLNRAIFVPK